MSFSEIVALLTEAMAYLATLDTSSAEYQAVIAWINSFLSYLATAPKTGTMTVGDTPALKAIMVAKPKLKP